MRPSFHTNRVSKYLPVKFSVGSSATAHQCSIGKNKAGAIVRRFLRKRWACAFQSGWPVARYYRHQIYLRYRTSGLTRCTDSGVWSRGGESLRECVPPNSGHFHQFVITRSNIAPNQVDWNNIRPAVTTLIFLFMYRVLLADRKGYNSPSIGCLS